MWLNVSANSAFNLRPDFSIGHEYGHVWSWYHFFLSEQGTWDPYLSARCLVGNTKLDSSYEWSRSEIIAEDYRLLFGSAAAISQGPVHMNTAIPDPRNVAGLREFLAVSFTG